MQVEWNAAKNERYQAKYSFTPQGTFSMNADVMNNTSKTDWARIDAMVDKDIDTSDIPPLSDQFFAKAQLRLPQLPVTVSISVDPEPFAWFQAQGETAEQQTAIALKLYADAHTAHSMNQLKVE